MCKKILNSSIILISLVSIVLSGCEPLDTKQDMMLTDEMLETNNYYLFGLGYKAYSHVPNGFSSLDGNLFASITDEAQYVTSASEAQRFNEGTWNQFYNPADNFGAYYQGIHDIHYFLQESQNFSVILAFNRDTLSSVGRDSYIRDTVDLSRLRAECHVLKAFYYFELFKRYGNVPIIDQLYDNPEEANLPRNTVEEIVDLIVDEIDFAKETLVTDWAVENQLNNTGRITVGAALAVKSRALLYAACPQFNPANSAEKWEKAAEAANDIIQLGLYSLHGSYENLFKRDNSNTSKETIWAVKLGQSNDFERANYPIGTPGGGTGICPSHNLVQAYEHVGEVTEDMYENLDPRFYASVLRNGDFWNGRTLEIYQGGTDDPAKPNTSPTGYYLKKFLNENLNLIEDASEIRSWLAFRYAEVMLNFAEAANEVYGPDASGSYAMTSREAVNMIRTRAGVPDISVPAGDKDAMRKAVKHERRIELAFEDHRYWDLRRWDEANEVLNQPVLGVQLNISGSDSIYQTIVVSDRVFIAPKMNLFPISQYAIVNSDGVLTQNEGW